jgi:hypothetical protein
LIEYKGDKYSLRGKNMTKNKVLNFFITSFNGMAIGLFATLIIGVIIGQIAKIFVGVDTIYTNLVALSTVLKSFMGIGIGFGIAIALKLDGIKLVITGVTGGIATYFYYDPMVAYITTISVYFVLKYLRRHL